MNHPLVAASLLLLTSTLVAADPIVTGNTISWPDDGWYQVQVVTDDGISEVCAGTLSCEVDPGIYIVINHTTGDRFKDIVVGGTSAVAEVTVSGNTIAWPDDGWYQVQAVTDSGIIEVCAGGRMCEVPNGVYIVINHSTGERFKNVVVGSEPSASGVMVSDNTISWPDDGWYQVQLVTDAGIIEVCAGGRSCDVPNGNYVVINHTTGERFRPVVVNADPDEFDPADLPTIRAENWPEILRNVIALINADRAVERHGMLLDRFASLSGFVVSETLAGGTSGTLASLGLTILPLADPQNNFAVDYSCDAGGQLGFNLEPGVSVYDVTADNCAIGSDVYDGRFRHNGVGREGFSSRIDDMTVNLSDSTRYSISGSHSTNFDRVGIRAQIQWSDASMLEQSGGNDYTVEAFNMRSEIADGSLPGEPPVSVTYIDGTEEAEVRSYLHSAAVTGNFMVSALWTENEPVQVSVDLKLGGSYLVTRLTLGLPIPYETLSGSLVYPATDLSTLPSQWVSGSVDVIAADGSRVSLRPMQDDNTRAFVDVDGINDPQQVLLSDGFQVRCYEFRADFLDCK